jgi:drug/metabolite transporter (DMT)-like permease
MTASRSSVARAAVWMVFADAGFVAMLLGIRVLSHHMPIFEVVFWRAFVASAAVIPWAVTARQRRALATKRMGLFATRALVVYGANLTYFYAAATMVLADAVALQFVIPLFTLVGAAIFLHEKVGPRRWTATAVGFAGAVVILRPGLAHIGWPEIAVLVSSALYAQNWLMVKALTRTETARIIVFYMNVLIVPMAAVGASFDWVWPDWSLAPLIVATGLVGWGAQICQARGFAAADASVVAPFDFLRLPMIAAAGWVLFRETADLWTWLGAAIIFAAATYITRREARLERAGRRKAAEAEAAAGE